MTLISVRSRWVRSQKPFRTAVKTLGRWSAILLTLFLSLAAPALAAPTGTPYTKQYAPPTSFSNAELAGQNFAGQTLRVAEFSNSNVNRANFSNADLQGAVFSASTMTETNLHGADLTQAMMDQIKIVRSNLERCRAGGCNSAAIDL